MPCQASIDAAVYYFEINAEISKGTSNQRSGSRPRSIVCYSAVQKLAMVGGLLAHKLNLTFSAVNKLISHGRHNPVSKDIAAELFD
jgi:hypothetical protein